MSTKQVNWDPLIMIRHLTALKASARLDLYTDYMFARELLFSRSDHTIHFSLLFKLWSFPALYIITIHQLIDGSSIQKCCSGVFCIALHLRAQINFLLRLSHQIMHFKITTQQSFRWAFLIVFENYSWKIIFYRIAS